jgi:hypothetical protein
MKPHGYLLTTIVLSLVAFDASAQSLADIARKERERQKQTQSKVTIIAGAAVSGSLPKPSTTGTALTPTPIKPIEPRDNKGRDEKYWRAAFQKARDDAKRAEDQAQLLDLRLKDLNTQFLRQSDIYNRETRVGLELATTQKELDEARRQADAAKQKLTDLEDELRKSGGPAGWAR